MDSYCVRGDQGIVLVRNTGTQEIDVGDIAVINTTSGDTPIGGGFYTLDGDSLSGSTIDVGAVAKYNMTCDGLCLFRFLVGGRSLTASVQC
jgi:hypothetical protein